MTEEFDIFKTLDSDLKDQLRNLKGEGVFLVKVVDFIDLSESYYVVDRNTNERKEVSCLNEAFVVLWEKMETLFNK